MAALGRRAILDQLPVRRIVATPPARFGFSALLLEDLTRRDAHAKHYRHPDGRTMVAVIGRDLHYQQADGSWDDVDLTLSPVSLDLSVIGIGSARSRTVHSTRAPCPVVVDGNTILVVDAAGRGIRFTWPSALSVSPDGARVTAQAHGLTWEYRPTPRGLKLTASCTAPLGKQTFTFPYGLLGETTPLRTREDGALESDTFALPPPIAHGADGLLYRVGTWRVQTNPDAVLLDYDDTAVPAAAFPLVLDPTVTFSVGVSDDDAWVYRSGTTWPPNGAIYVSSNNTYVGARRLNSSGSYELDIGLFRWNTSSLAGQIVFSAKFRGYVNSKQSPDNRSLTFEWYSWTPPASASHYTDVVGTSAHAGTPIANIASSEWNEIQLTNPSSINTTGYTGLRIHVTNSVTPTGFNEVWFYSFDAGTQYAPQLVVTYGTPVALAGTSAGSTTTGVAVLRLSPLALAGATAAGTTTGAAQLEVFTLVGTSAGSTTTGVAALNLQLALAGTAAGSTTVGVALLGVQIFLIGAAAGGTVAGTGVVLVRMLPVAVRATHRPVLTILATTRPTG